MIKTTQAAVTALREAVVSKHPYEVPEFIAISPTDVSDSYKHWMESVVIPENGRGSS